MTIREELEAIEKNAFRRVKYARLKAAKLRQEADELRIRAGMLDRKADKWDQQAAADAKISRRDFDPLGVDGFHDV